MEASELMKWVLALIGLLTICGIALIWAFAKYGRFKPPKEGYIQRNLTSYREKGQ